MSVKPEIQRVGERNRKIDVRLRERKENVHICFDM